MSRSSWSRVSWLGIAAAAVVTGCAKKEAEPVAQTAPNHVLVTASDFAFQAPDSVPAGLAMFHLVNKGPSLHHINLVQLDSGKTLADLMTALKNPGPPPAWTHALGGPNAVPPTGLDTAVTYAVLAPGNYALLCFIPDSAGRPHFALGMARALTVTPSAATPTMEPHADVVIHATDYAFTIRGNLTAGSHVIRFVNDGPQPHEVLFVALPPRKRGMDVVKWVEAGMKGMPPARPMGGTSGLDPQGHTMIAATFAKGNYALICFLPDAKDGKMHARHGMVKDITVN